MSGLEFREGKWLCDGCTGGPPTTRYDVPAGMPIVATKDTRTGEVTRVLSSGSWGLCAPCRAEVDTAPTTAIAARRLMLRMSAHAPALAGIPAGSKAIALAALLNLNERVLPLLKNPRPAIRGAEPLDGRSVWCDAAPPAPAPSAN